MNLQGTLRVAFVQGNTFSELEQNLNAWLNYNHVTINDIQIVPTDSYSMKIAVVSYYMREKK